MKVIPVIESSIEFTAGDALSFDHDIAIGFISAQSRLEIAAGKLCIDCTESPPCAWWRFWQWALLGWRWVDLREADGDDDDSLSRTAANSGAPARDHSSSN